MFLYNCHIVQKYWYFFHRGEFDYIISPKGFAINIVNYWFVSTFNSGSQVPDIIHISCSKMEVNLNV